MCLSVGMMVFYLLGYKIVIAQPAPVITKGKVVVATPIGISCTKTSNLIFPYPIVSVDRGSAELLAQKASGAENILQIKAAVENFQETNLSVITSDAHLYSFLVNYHENPAILNLELSKDSAISTGAVTLSEGKLSQRLEDVIVDSVRCAPLFMRHSSREQKVKLMLRSIYLSGDKMWFHFQVENKSFIDYSPEGLRAFVSDKRTAARTAIQEKEMLPVACIAPTTVKGKASEELIVGFPSFTIPSKQKFCIELKERNGGRTIRLELCHRAILRARLLGN